MKLYDFRQSSAAWRVRIALHLKDLPVETVQVSLAEGAHRRPEHLARHPLGLVPGLEADGHFVPQSLAILEFLEELHPEPPLLPREPLARARVRGLALAVACEIHPLQNKRVREHLDAALGLNDDGVFRWCEHWVRAGLTASEATLAGDPATGRFAHGEGPTLADCCLVPQVRNAEVLFGCDTSSWPVLDGIYRRCLEQPAFAETHPDR